MAILIYRRRTVGPVFSATTVMDKVMYAFLATVILLACGTPSPRTSSTTTTTASRSRCGSAASSGSTRRRPQGRGAEHVSFDAQLEALDATAADFHERVQSLLDELSLHIDKENLGIFPVAVVTLGASGWETVGRAHEEL